MRLGGTLLEKNKILEKNCLFICFADYDIGVGHLFRSQILAKRLKSLFWNNFLFGPNIKQQKIVRKNLFKKIFYSKSIDKTKLLNELNNNIIEIIKKNKINLIIIDSYLINNEFQKKIKDKLILKISNIEKNNKYCDLVLDYSFNSKISNNSPKYLLGPKYCLVENKIKNIKKIKTKKILVTFGGSNLLPQFSNTVKVLKKELPRYKIYISTPSKDLCKNLKKKLTGVSIVLVNTLSEIIIKHNFDLIISSAGHSMYELAVNSYPTLFVGMYKNQYANINYLKKNGGAKVLKYNNYSYNRELSTLLNQYKKDYKIFNINKKISSQINFNGNEEVAKILDFKFFKKLIDSLPVLYTKRLKLIPLSKKNILELYFLRNKIIRNKMIFKESNLLSKTEHMKWFQNYNAKKRIDYLIFEKKAKIFIGAMHFKIKKDELEIGKFISNPLFLGKNYGFEAANKWIKFGINELGYKKIIAITSKKNVININLNKKLGFKTTKYNNLWQKMIYK